MTGLGVSNTPLKAMEIKEITDSVSIFKMIETLYKQFPVYTISDRKPKQVRIIAVKSQGVFIQSPDVNPNPTERTLILTNAGNLLQFRFKINTKDPRGIELLYPIALTIQTATRASSRYQANKIPLYVTNIISQSMIPHGLSQDNLKVEGIIKSYSQKLKAKFSELDFFIHERMDTRARLMTDTGKHIFIPDAKTPESVTDEFVAFNEYSHLIKQGKGLSKFQSEICIPLKYKGIISYGYLQVLNQEKTDINDYNLVLHAVNKFTKELEDSDIFNESKFKTTIMDISTNGFSLSHPQSKHFGKLFSLGGTILFDIYEEEKSLGTFRGVVRNIKPLEKLFRIGCQFFHLADEYKIIEELIQKFFPESQNDELKPMDLENITYKNE